MALDFEICFKCFTENAKRKYPTVQCFGDEHSRKAYWDEWKDGICVCPAEGNTGKRKSLLPTAKCHYILEQILHKEETF